MSDASGNALKEYLDLVDHETESMESFLHGLPQGYKNGKRNPEAQELIEQAILKFKREATVLTNPAIKALSAKITHETELALRELANEKPEKKEKKEEETYEGHSKKKAQDDLAELNALDAERYAHAYDTALADGKTGEEAQDAAQTFIITQRGEDAGKQAYEKALADGKPEEEALSAKDTAKTAILEKHKDFVITGDVEETLKHGRDISKIRTETIAKARAEGKNETEIAKAEWTAVQTFVASYEKAPIQFVKVEKPATDEIVAPPTKKRIPSQIKAGVVNLGEKITGTKAPNLRPLRPMPTIMPSEDEVITDDEVEVSTDRGAGTRDRRAIPGNPNARARIPAPFIPLSIPSDDEDEEDDDDDHYRPTPRKANKLGKKLAKKGLKNFAKNAVRRGAIRVVVALTSEIWVPLLIILGLILLIIIILIIIFSKNQSDQATACLNTQQKLAVNLSGPTTASAGQQLSYKIEVTYGGIASDVVIHDPLPQNTTFVQASGKYTLDNNIITWSAKDNGLATGTGNSSASTATAASCGVVSTPGSVAVGDICSGANIQINYSKKVSSTSFYEPTDFGCSAGYKDPDDNCIPNGLSQIPECAGLSGPSCEEKLQYFSANAAQYGGYNSLLKVTNPLNGKTVIVKTIDTGPACSVQQTNAKFDMSKAAYDAIGATTAVYVQPVDASTPLGPVLSCSAGSSTNTTTTTTNSTTTNTSTVNTFSPMSFDLVLKANDGVDNTHIVNQAQGEIVGEQTTANTTTNATTNDSAGLSAACSTNTTANTTTAASGTVTQSYVAPNTNDCSGKYTSAISKNVLGKNFGDPACSFSKDNLYSLLKQQDPTNADEWFSKIIPCESSYNPNDTTLTVGSVHTPDPNGAWGLYQMGSSKPPGSEPPAPGRNGIYDRGDVNWEVQTFNATSYGKKLSDLGKYWACAR